VKNCSPACDEYYHVRMPHWFHQIDMVICFIYLIQYVLKLYISQNRCTYFIDYSNDYTNLVNLTLIICPPLVLPYESDSIGLFLVSLSRLIRVTKSKLLVTVFIAEDASEVTKTIF